MQNLQKLSEVSHSLRPAIPFSRFLIGLSIFCCLSVNSLFAETKAAKPAPDPPEKTQSFDTVLIVENDVEIKTRLTGIVEEILVERGSWVNKGDPLARLQNDDLALEVQKAKVRMQEQQAQYDRAKSLFDQKLLSASEYDEKRLAFEQASAEHDLAKVDFEKSIIKAPFRGVVVERFVKPGQRVVEDDNVALFRITAMEPLLARLFIPEEKMIGIATGQKVEFIPTFDSTKRYAARIKWISAAIDPASGTVSIIVELLPGEGRGMLKPGTSGKIVLRTGSAGKATSSSP